MHQLNRPPTRRSRRKPVVHRVIALLAMMMLALTGGIAIAPAAHSDSHFQRGPDPTERMLEARSGPFSTSSTRVSSLVSGFGGGQIYYPTTTSQGTFGGIAISPGYTASWSSMSWLGPYLASHGFVVIGIETNNRLDQPASRGRQLEAALDYLVSRSSVSNRVDQSRLAVAGHSMGGGGTLAAARSRPELLAAIPLTPWHTTKSWSTLRVPTMIVGAQNDSVASVRSHAIPFYQSLPSSLDKAYLEFRREGHFFPNSFDSTLGKYMVSWLKRFVDNDIRYEQFLCPPPRTGLFTPFSDYRDTCPHG